MLFGFIGGLSSGMLITILGTAAAFFGGKWLFKKDEKKEDRRRTTMDLAVWAAQNGLEILVPIMKDYTVGDYSSLIHRIRQFEEKLQDGSIKDAIEGFLRKQLELRLSDPAAKTKLLAEYGERLGVKVTPAREVAE